MSLLKPAETLTRNMSIKERFQELIQETEAQKAAEARRREEENRLWSIERQKEIRQQEVRETLEKAKFEKAKKTLEATGVQRIFGEAIDILRKEDPEVKFQMKKGLRYHFPAESKSVKGKEGNGEYVDTVAMVVEAQRGMGETTISLGVQMEVDSPTKIYALSAKNPHSTIYKAAPPFIVNDKNLLPKLERRFAEIIIEGSHRDYKSWPDTDTYDGGYDSSNEGPG